MTIIGVSPFEIVDSVRRLLQHIYNIGFETIEWVFRYFWLGIIIVFSLWATSRLRSIFYTDNYPYTQPSNSATDHNSNVNSPPGASD
jgi:hypothetical protein